MRTSIAIFVLLFSVALAQVPGFAQQDAASPAKQVSPANQQHSADADELAQMRADLSKMESLNGNMSSEIEFLHDQNLQILLRTNSQMWTMLIRDLRRRIDREERRRSNQR